MNKLSLTQANSACHVTSSKGWQFWTYTVKLHQHKGNNGRQILIWNVPYLSMTSDKAFITGKAQTGVNWYCMDCVCTQLFLVRGRSWAELEIFVALGAQPKGFHWLQGVGSRLWARLKDTEQCKICLFTYAQLFKKGKYSLALPYASLAAVSRTKTTFPSLFSGQFVIQSEI